MRDFRLVDIELEVKPLRLLSAKRAARCLARITQAARRNDPADCATPRWSQTPAAPGRRISARWSAGRTECRRNLSIKGVEVELTYLNATRCRPGAVLICVNASEANQGSAPLPIKSVEMEDSP